MAGKSKPAQPEPTPAETQEPESLIPLHTFAIPANRPQTPFPFPEGETADEERYGILAALSAPFPPAAIQRTKAKETKKGYDTTGIGYAWITQRLNEVLGIGGWDLHAEYRVEDRETSTGKTMYTVTSTIRLAFGRWIFEEAGAVFQPWARAEAHGEHASLSYGDAHKGGLTNGLKKTAAMLGVAWQVYAGALDPDAQPLPEAPGEGRRRSNRRDEPEPRERDSAPPEPSPAHLEQERLKARMTELVEALGKPTCTRIRAGRPMKSLPELGAVVADLEAELERRIAKSSEGKPGGVVASGVNPEAGAPRLVWLARFWAIVEAMPGDEADGVILDLKELHGVTDPDNLSDADLIVTVKRLEAKR